MPLKTQVGPVYLYRPKRDFDIMAAIVAAIAVSATAATAVGITVSENVQTVTTVNKLAERVSSTVDLQNQINGPFHFGLLTLNEQMVLLQEQVDILWAHEHDRTSDIILNTYGESGKHIVSSHMCIGSFVNAQIFSELDWCCQESTCLTVMKKEKKFNVNKDLIVRETPISGVHTFYTDANKQGKAGYKSEDLSKVVQSPYNSVQKSELYAILLVLMDFSEPLNIVTDSQYAERVVLHIETAEFIPDESELTSLFIQLQDIIRNRKHPLYITHIRSHTGLPGPLAQGNDEIDKLLIGNVLEASEFHKKHHVNSKGLKRDFSITWQQAKEIVRKCPTCSFYNQTPLPAGCNPKGTQRNDIWQMDVFHFAEFGKLKYVHHTIDTYSGFQWATALSSEKADSVITHLLEVMAIMGIPAQIKTDNAPAYVSGKMKQFFAYYNIKHITGIPHNPTGQAVIERSNRTLKNMLNKQKGVTKTPRNRLHNALLTLNFLNANEKGTTAAERHWIIEKTAELNQPIYFKDVLTSEWKPGYVLRWGRGFAFISTGEDKLWIPSKLIKVRFEQKTS
ncbi:hypothetical protein STEG23_025180 [Scotinomys teguina]